VHYYTGIWRRHRALLIGVSGGRASRHAPYCRLHHDHTLMKRLLVTLGAAWLLLGCGPGHSDFDLAGRAIYEHNTNALAAILARNKDVVTNVSGFDGATLLHHSLANVPDIGLL